MTKPFPDLGARLLRGRERVGLSQDEVGLLVGQPRTVISNWETSDRRPNSAALIKLSSVYRTPIEELLGAPPSERPAFDAMLFRNAGDRLAGAARFEIERFLEFLDDYAELLQPLDEPPGLQNAPFSIREGFASKEDIRRRAEDARTFLRLGPGPIGDLGAITDLVGISVYHAPLGANLNTTISGAFLPHDRVGFAILINAETTPGRRQFTLAHELAHALFHGGRPYVGWLGRPEAVERFADQFAAEFLVPIASLRAAAESVGLTKVRDPEVAVHLQRYFRVSYAMLLVRLRAARLADDEDIEAMRQVHPVHVAERLGYSIAPDEWSQEPDAWGLARFPKRFLRLLRRAFDQGLITLSGASAMTGLSDLDLEQSLKDIPATPTDKDDFDALSASA